MLNNEHEMAVKADLKLENQVCFPLYSAANAITRTYRPLLKQLDLTYLQYLVMMVLWSNNVINVKKLGDKLNLDSGTLTPLLKRLETKSLLVRKPNELDERIKDLHLTPEGVELKTRAAYIPNQLVCQLDMDLDDLLQLKYLCEKLLTKSNSVK